MIYIIFVLNLNFFLIYKKILIYQNILQKKIEKLELTFLEGYSTGKSSLLNCLIGKDILPTGSNITTNREIIIRNNEQGKYILYKTKFIKKGDY